MDPRKRRRSLRSRRSEKTTEEGQDVDSKNGGKCSFVMTEAKNRSAEVAISDSEEEWLPDEGAVGKEVRIWKI